MANPSLGDTRSTLHSIPTATPDSALVPGPACNLPSRTNASAMDQFSLELREIEAVHALNTMSQVTETQLDTEAIMHELSVDSEVTFRKVMGSAEFLPTRSSVDPNEVTRPMDETWPGSASTPSDWSGLQLTTVSPSVFTSTSHHTSTPEPLHMSHVFFAFTITGLDRTYHASRFIFSSFFLYFFTARCIYISAVYVSMRCLSVCLSVCHVRDLLQNE